AEDGIRDATVTGVQTCALPIYLRRLLDLVSTSQGPRIPHLSEGRDHFLRAQVEHGLRVFLVPRGRRVAPEAQDVVDAERRGPEQVRLEADAIPVPRDHLHDGLDAFLQYDRGRGQGGNPNEGPLPIRPVPCVAGPALA